MHRVLWASMMYVVVVAVFVLTAGRAFVDAPTGRFKAFGLQDGQSPLAMSVALPALGIATYGVAALLDLVTV